MAKINRLKRLSALAVVLCAAAPAAAQHPDWKSHPVTPRIDVIPPLGNNLPLSHSARYNRPGYVTGKIAYWIAPSSREAMSWQRAYQLGYYADHAPRMVTHYCFPKPWEVLGTGARTDSSEPSTPSIPMPVAPPAAAPTQVPSGIELVPPAELPPAELPPPEQPSTLGELIKGLE